MFSPKRSKNRPSNNPSTFMPFFRGKKICLKCQKGKDENGMSSKWILNRVSVWGKKKKFTFVFLVFTVPGGVFSAPVLEIARREFFLDWHITMRNVRVIVYIQSAPFGGASVPGANTLTPRLIISCLFLQSFNLFLRYIIHLFKRFFIVIAQLPWFCIIGGDRFSVSITDIFVS